MIEHPEYKGIYQEILGNPDDDVPRLIAADWLEDNGHPQRAEFIRVQIQLHNLDKNLMVQWQNLIDRQNKLWVESDRGNSWKLIDSVVGEFSPVGWNHCLSLSDPTTLGNRAVYRRGFIDQVHATFDDLDECLSKIVKRHPITRVSVSNKEADHEENNRFHWYLAAGDYDDPDAIPTDVFDAMTDYLEPGSSGLVEKTYRTRADADLALSEALLFLARMTKLQRDEWRLKRKGSGDFTKVLKEQNGLPFVPDPRSFIIGPI